MRKKDMAFSISVLLILFAFYSLIEFYIFNVEYKYSAMYFTLSFVSILQRIVVLPLFLLVGGYHFTRFVVIFTEGKLSDSKARRLTGIALRAISALYFVLIAPYGAALTVMGVRQWISAYENASFSGSISFGPVFDSIYSSLLITAAEFPELFIVFFLSGTAIFLTRKKI